LRNFKAGLALVAFDYVILWAGIRTPLLLAALAPYGSPVVLHAGNPFAGGSRVRLLLRVGLLLPRPRSVTVIGCSAHVARTFRRAPYYRRLAVESCLNPIDVPTANPYRARPLDPTMKVHVGMVARLDLIKDHPALLRAFQLVRREWPKAELHLAGDGPLRAELESLAGKLGQAEAVHFHGSIAQIPEFLRGLDLFCYFTTSQEGMGNALAEALAQGLPCVVNDIPVMREVTGDGEDRGAYLVPTDPKEAAKAITELLMNTPARERLSQAAYQRAITRFSPRLVVERYVALLEATA
jgi:glycosyltransferase involved in cell wall biosynthesis